MGNETVRPVPMCTAITGIGIIDGTGGAEYPGDILLRDGLINRILPAGTLVEDEATVVMDGSGLVACPGFIDLHGQGGTGPDGDQAQLAALRQGVTTMVLGQDGSPRAPDAGSPAFPLDRGDSRGTMGRYLDLLDQGRGTNVACLVSQGAVRAMAGATGTPTAEQLATQVKFLAEALDQGAVGLSSGPEDASGPHVPSPELEALCTAVAARGGYWSPGHGPGNGTVLDAVARSVALAARTGVSVHLARAGSISAEGKEAVANLGSMLDSAQDSGIDLSCDSHPDAQGPVPLSSLLPAWARNGSATDILARLEDADTVARIRTELQDDQGRDWDAVLIASVGSRQLSMLVGQDVAGIAAIQSTDPVTTYLRILCADSLAAGFLPRRGNREALEAFLGHRSHLGAGLRFRDAAGTDAGGALPSPAGGEGGEGNRVDLPALVHQLTGRPAARLRLARRGLLAAGYAADVLVLDRDAMIDRAVFADPRHLAAGIKHVFVNGVAAVTEHLPTSALAGRALRRSAEGMTQST